MLRNLMCLLMTIIFISYSSAQAQEQEKGGIVDDTKKDLIVITGCGLGGAILGLSTLSFVDEPEDHYKNIIVGGAIGVIAGVIVVASLQANRTGNYIEQDVTSIRSLSPQFDTTGRKIWHQSSVAENSVSHKNQFFSMNYSF